MGNAIKGIPLEKCPFCGAPGEVVEHSDGDRYKPRCSGITMCLAEMIYRWFDTPEEAAAAWNTRCN
ncbi:MAG: Lar family restriction alleviation protein [Clostridia bacterium]|nr:Lar family restriction alleviation protein [Clostridia bacterium]